MSEIVVLDKEALRELIVDVVNETMKHQMAKSEPQIILQDENKFLSAAEACRMMKISRTTLWVLTRNNEIPFIKFGRKLLFDKSQIESFLAQKMMTE